MDALFRETEFYNVKELVEYSSDDDFKGKLYRGIQKKRERGIDLSDLERVVDCISIVDVLIIVDGMESYCRDLGPVAMKNIADGLETIGAAKKSELFREIVALIDENGVGWPEDACSDDSSFIELENAYNSFIDDNLELLSTVESRYYEILQEESIDSLFVEYVKNHPDFELAADATTYSPSYTDDSSDRRLYAELNQIMRQLKENIDSTDDLTILYESAPDEAVIVGTQQAYMNAALSLLQIAAKSDEAQIQKDDPMSEYSNSIKSAYNELGDVWPVVAYIARNPAHAKRIEKSFKE